MKRDTFGERFRRRRVCLSCQQRFTTYEFVEPHPKKKYFKSTPYALRKPRKATTKRKQPSTKTDWLQKILRRLDETETHEKVLRQKI
jgi:transcriptional regulator NrdR family protein